MLAIAALIAARVSAQTTVEVRTFDERIHVGRIESWQLDGDLVIKGPDAEGRIKSADVDVVNVRRPVPTTQASGASAKAEWLLEGRGGTRLRGEPVRGDDRTLTWRQPTLGQLTLPTQLIRRIARRDASRLPNAGSDDVLTLSNGDTLRGAIGGFDGDGVTLVDADGGEQRFAWAAIRALDFASTPESVAGVAARLLLLDGDSIEAPALSWDLDRIGLRLDREAVSVSTADVSRIEIVGGRRVRLGELAPAKYRSIPFFSQTWPIRVDQNAVGGPLVVAGRRATRGLGLHSACEVEWALDGRFERFVAEVGIDGSA